MATRDIVLKRQLIKNGVICAVMLMIISAGGMLLSNYDDDAQAEKHVEENHNSSIRSEHDAIAQELGTGFEVNAFYETYIKYHNDDLVLKRDIASQILSALHEKHHLSNLSVTISPVSDVLTPEFGLIKSGTLMKSDVRLTFGAVTDNSVYGFIEDLERKLPGIVIIQDIKLARAGDPSRTMLVNLSEHKLTPLVTGEISFAWLGIRPAEESAAGAAASSPSLKGQNHGF